MHLIKIFDKLHSYQETMHTEIIEKINICRLISKKTIKEKLIVLFQYQVTFKKYQTQSQSP